MPPKKKGLLKKLEKERRIQEELARIEREELLLKQEEERQRREEIERLKAEEDRKRNEHLDQLASYSRRIFSLCHLRRFLGWQERRWNDYVYKTKEMDSLKLPVVNSFISEWEDDSSYDIEEIFRKSHLCLQTVDDIQYAMITCPEVLCAKKHLWKEGIENLKEAILTKLNYASFMLLKDAILYKNEKSQNMEYSYQEGDIALLLWANIHRAKRRHGMERIGFRFWIPPDLSSEDCAVRILQLAFEPSFRVLDLPKEISEPEENIEVDDPRESNEIILREIEENADENVEGEAPAETIVELKVEDAAVTGAQTEVVEIPDTPVVEQKTSKPDLKLPDSHVDKEQQADVVDKSYREDRFTVTEDVGTSEEGKGKCLDLNEYLLIGGFLHFDLLEVPKLTISKNGFTYYYKEKPELKKIKCEPRAFDPLEKEDESVFEEEIVPEEPPAVEKMPPQPEENPDEMEEYLSEEIIRLSIGLQMPLPKNVLFVDVPIPARYCPKNKGFLTEGINLEDYNDEERWITFETDLFGIFGLFQKRYFNFPYKLWKLQGGKTVELSLTGKCLSLRIEISQEGCRVKSIKPGKFDVSELLKSDDWMTPEELLQKLCLVGINMIYKRKDHKLVGLSPKNYQLEELTYNSMALLSEEYDFSWSKWNCKLPPGGIALNYERADQRKEERLNLALIRRERVIQLKHGEEMMEFNNEPVDEQKFSGTLFDLVLQEPPKEPHKFIAQSGCKENVRLLLRKTAILSCS